jgi:hypothetical protein
VDRNLAGYLPRLADLVSIAAHRPGAWFPGPLGPYQAWFLGIDLSQDFKRAKVPGNPMKSPFCFCVFWGSYSKKNIFASRQPNHVNHLLSGLYDVLKCNFYSQRSPPGNPRVAHWSRGGAGNSVRSHGGWAACGGGATRDWEAAGRGRGSPRGSRPGHLLPGWIPVGERLLMSAHENINPAVPPHSSLI